MRRLILFFISSCAALFVCAQEEIFSDSIVKKQLEIKVRQLIIERPLNFDKKAFHEEINLMDNFLFHQSLLPDYNKNLNFKRYFNPSKETGPDYNFTGYSFDTVFPFGHIFNQSSLRLNDRLQIGGNTFGARSVFDQPKLNSTIQDMSIKGASIFMQYKVSDHFKVQTRVSISNHNSPVWEP